MKNKEYSAEELRNAIAYRTQNPLVSNSTAQAFSQLIHARDLDSRISIAQMFYASQPKSVIAALILYGMDLAAALDDLSECEPGDYHCLEHKEKNCKCACAESASQVGKSEEVLNPAGPRYF